MTRLVITYRGSEFNPHNPGIKAIDKLAIPVLSRQRQVGSGVHGPAISACSMSVIDPVSKINKRKQGDDTQETHLRLFFGPYLHTCTYMNTQKMDTRLIKTF